MTLVWYAAYGSNMSRDRLLDYLTGRRPVGAARRCRGCRDTRPPRDGRPFMLPGVLSFGGFGGPSTNWNGGVAFFAPGPDTADPVLARAWLISIEQFADIVAQENVTEPGSIAIDRGLHDQEVARGWYGRVLLVGELDGKDVLTFTGARSPDLIPPSRDYVRYVAGGLREAHGLGPREVATYLASKPGVEGHLTSDDVLEMLEP